MYHFVISVAVLSCLTSVLDAQKASAQLGFDSIVRQLGERAVEELARPDPPQTTAPRTTAPTPQRHTAPSGPTQSEVLEVQQGLARLGYNPGTPDGLMGPNTASAIAAFQRDNGLRQIGTVNATLLSHLRTTVAGTGGSGGGAAPQQVVRPSFDCARAGTPTEYAICGTPELAHLDRQMADAYAAARAQAADPSAVADAQRSWMSRRNACLSNVTCLRAAMQQRIGALGGEANTQKAGVIDSQGGTGFSADTDALMEFDRDVYLIRFSEPPTTNVATVQFSTSNMDDSDVELLTGAIEDAISARPTFAGLRADAANLAIGALSFESYTLVAGDWRNRVTYAIESRYPDVDINVIQIARAAGTAPAEGSPQGATAPLPAADFAADDRPLLRAWLPHYLDRTTDAEQIKVIESHILRLQQSRDFSANLLFGEGEIEGRQPGFLARSVHDRWRDTFRKQSLEPPFEMRVRGQQVNLEYDFETGELVLFSGVDPRRTYTESISHTILRSGIIETGGLARSANYLGVGVPPHPIFGLDRELPTRFSMPASQAEEMMSNRDIVTYDAALRVTRVGEEENSYGKPRLTVDFEVLGVTVTTDAGVQIAALSAEDMPRIAPPQDEVIDTEPAQETVHLARPRDILAAVATRSGADVAELIKSVYPSTSLSAFEQRDDIAALAASAEEIDPEGFWMSGYGRLGDYDPENAEYGLDYVQLIYPDGVMGNEKRIRRRDLLRLANVSAGSGVRFEMSEHVARHLHDGVKGSDARFRARLALQLPPLDDGASPLPLTTDLLELVVLKPGSDPGLDNDDDVLARIDLAPQTGRGSTETDDQAPTDAELNGAKPTVNGFSGAYDLLGLWVGEPLEDGLALIRPKFEPERVLHGQREIWIDEGLSPKIEATTPLAESVVLVRNGDRDFLTIFHEPLVEGDPITGIARTVTFAEGARPRPEAIQDLLVDKYGEVDKTYDNALLWSRIQQEPIPEATGEMSVGDLIALSTEQQKRQTDSFVCRKEFESKVMALDYRINMSSRQKSAKVFNIAHRLVDEAENAVTHPPSQPLWPMVVSEIPNAECNSDFVMAVIQTDEPGLVSALRVLVTNRAYVASIEEAAQSALLERSAVEQVTPEIDF